LGTCSAANSPTARSGRSWHNGPEGQGQSLPPIIELVDPDMHFLASPRHAIARHIKSRDVGRSHHRGRKCAEDPEARIIRGVRALSSASLNSIPPTPDPTAWTKVGSGFGAALGWLWSGLCVAITSQTCGLPPVYPLYSPCMPLVLNTLAPGFQVASQGLEPGPSSWSEFGFLARGREAPQTACEQRLTFYAKV
jgi:hypothetical protein